MDLTKLRDKIDAIDEQILHLLEQRMDVVKEVGELKRESKAPIYRPERERAIVERLTKLSNGRLARDVIEAIYFEIFAVSRNLELPERVAYLGPEGSFTHQAAESRFGAMGEYLSMQSISSVFKSVESKRAKYGVVPIENNTDGVVSETLDLIGASNLKIVAEVFMPIHQSLVTKCEHLNDIKQIYSKDIAFGQCREFLKEHNLDSDKVRFIPTLSTSEAAKMAADEPNSAAICSNIAGRLYNLPILFSNIEDNHSNTTRFIIISDFENQISGSDKTSILAKISDSQKAGSLFNFLKDFNEERVNLTKIESRPVKDGEFSYCFYIDFEGHFYEERIQKILQNHTNEIKWLGSYVKSDNI